MRTFVRLILGHLSLLTISQSFSSIFRDSRRHLISFTNHWSRIATKMSTAENFNANNNNNLPHSISTTEIGSVTKEAIKRKDGAYLVVRGS